MKSRFFFFNGFLMAVVLIIMMSACTGSKSYISKTKFDVDNYTTKYDPRSDALDAIGTYGDRKYTYGFSFSGLQRFDSDVVEITGGYEVRFQAYITNAYGTERLANLYAVVKNGKVTTWREMD